MTSADLYLGLDLGGTHFRVAAFSHDGRLVHRLAFQTSRERGLAAVLDDLEHGLRDVVTRHGPARAIGVAAPGPIDPRTGVLYDPPNLSGWNEVHLKEELERRLGAPVVAGNDANFAAVGEAEFGIGRGARSLCYFTISTGIGGGIIENGELVLGGHGFAGEFGHQIVLPDGPHCACGGYGHLEALASGTAIARIARERLSAGTESVLLSIVSGDPDRVDAAAVAEAARQGDRLARSILDGVVRYLAIGIANTIHGLDPNVVVLGGGVMHAADLLLEPLRRQVEQLLMRNMRGRVRIEQAALGDDAGLWGAFAMARRACGSYESKWSGAS